MRHFFIFFLLSTHRQYAADKRERDEARKNELKRDTAKDNDTFDKENDKYQALLNAAVNMGLIDKEDLQKLNDDEAETSDQVYK